MSMEVQTQSSIPEIMPDRKRYSVIAYHIPGLSANDLFPKCEDPAVKDLLEYRPENPDAPDQIQTVGITSILHGEDTAIVESCGISLKVLKNAIKFGLPQDREVQVLEKATCFVGPDYIFGIGHSGVIQHTVNSLANHVFDCAISPVDLDDLPTGKQALPTSAVDRLSAVTSITIKNSSETEVRQATLRGKDIEQYLGYNVVNKAHHEVLRLAGVLKTDNYGNLKITFSKNGRFAFSWALSMPIDFLVFKQIFHRLTGVAG